MSTFIIFGAAKPGIGQAVTRRLLSTGSSIIGTFENEDTKLAQELKSEYKKLNLIEVDHSSMKSLLDFLRLLPSTLAGVVIAQMQFDIRDALDLNEEAWNQGLAVNLTLPHFAGLKCGPKIQPGGSIVTITSTEGFTGSFGAAGYAASKAAIHNLVKTHANILGPKGVRANAVAAGWIGGVMDTDEVFNMSRRITPLGRLGTADEIASVTSFLLGSDASFVTGATIVVDGGYTCVDTIAKYEYDALNSV